MSLKFVYKLKNGLRELKWSWYFIRITKIHITLILVAMVGFIYRPLFFSNVSVSLGLCLVTVYGFFFKAVLAAVNSCFAVIVITAYRYSI